MDSYNEGHYSYVNGTTESPNWIIFYLLVLTAEICGLISSILIIYWGHEFMEGYAWDGSGKMFNYHPVFMILGFVFLYGNATIIYRTLRTTPKFIVKFIHAGIQILGLIFAVLGLYCVFRFHNNHNIPNMYSLHSWIGIATVVLFGCQLLMGFLAFLLPMFSDDYKRKYLYIHVLFGMAILCMAIAACVTGLTEKMLFTKSFQWSSFPVAGNIANVITLLLVTFGILIGYILYNPSYKRTASA